MFFDPTTKPEVKAGPYSLESLIAWLEKQPGDTRFKVTRSESCLIAQYLIAHGIDKYNLLSREVVAKFGTWAIKVICAEPPTFGAALERARDAAASQS